MESTCAYCGTYFTAKRVSKKYCSDNCKQMAYYTRNGLVLSGISINTPNSIINEENKVPVVKGDTQPIQQEPIPLTVKSLIQTDSVKCSTDNETVKVTKEENTNIKPTSENIPDNNTLEIQLACFMQAMDNKFNRVVAELKKELNIKYDELIVKYDSLIEKQEQSVKDNKQNEIIEQDFTLTPKQPETTYAETTPTHETHQLPDSREFATYTEENETVQEEESKEENQIQKTSTTNPEPKHPDKIEPIIGEEPPYKWIQAKLMRLIEYKYMDDDSADMLKEPSRYWSYEQVKQVAWINVRLRCLIESIIKLSNYSRIDTHTLFCVADAFNRLLHSSAFKNIPDNYPYKMLIPDLCNKLTQMAEQNKNESELAFHLPLERKAQLLAIRYQMQNYVTVIKFSEMDFTEGNTQTYKPKYAA